MKVKEKVVDNVLKVIQRKIKRELKVIEKFREKKKLKAIEKRIDKIKKMLKVTLTMQSITMEGEEVTEADIDMMNLKDLEEIAEEAWGCDLKEVENEET